MTEARYSIRHLKALLRRRREPGLPPPSAVLTVRPIGRVEGEPDLGQVEVVIDDAWDEALDGIEAFSHLWVVWWLSRRAEPPTRLHVRPEGRADMPLLGLFATRSPHRPNPIAITAVRLVARRGRRLLVEGLDADPGSPVLDLKPYLRRGDLIEEANVPGWLARLWASHDRERETTN